MTTMIEDDNEVEFADLECDSPPFYQISPDEGRVLRVCFLRRFCKAKAGYYHWHRGGFYRCNTMKDGPEAICCKLPRSWTCINLSLVYLNAGDDGKLAKNASIKFRIGYIGLSRSLYTQVATYLQEAPERDLGYTKSDGYSFLRASLIPRWQLAPEAARVEAEAKRFADGRRLVEKLGKKLTDEQFERLIRTGFYYPLEED